MLTARTKKIMMEKALERSFVHKMGCVVHKEEH